MRAVFLGTPEFGRTVLERLVAAGIEVPLVITQPDRPRQRHGRGAAEPSPVATWAEAKGLTVAKPVEIRTAIGQIEAAEPDVVIVAAYGQLLPDDVLKTAGGRWLNVHGSLLPKYRGASPIQQAIIDGEPETGATIMEVVQELDAGPIVSQRSVPIAADDTAGTLMEKVALVGASLLVETLPEYLDGSLKPKAQDDASSTMTRTLAKADGALDWSLDAPRIERFIRAMQPWPGATTLFDGQPIMIVKARNVPSAAGGAPGQFGESPPLLVAAGEGSLRIARLKPAGKKEMDGEAWLRGLRRGGRFVSG